MPFKPIEHPKCPKCGKSVYAAEEMVAGGYKWHKFCFKCSMCNKLLDSTTVAEHGAELFCKQCHGRKYGPKGVGFGLGAGSLTMDDGARFGNTVNEMGSADGAKPAAYEARYSMLANDAGKQTAAAAAAAPPAAAAAAADAPKK